MFFWGRGTLLVNAYVAYKLHMEMEGEVPMSRYDFRKAIVLDKVDLLGHGAPTQRESFSVQRGDPRAMSRMIKKRKDRSTYKKRHTRSAGSKIYATKQPASKCPAAKKKIGTYVTDNRVAIESIWNECNAVEPEVASSSRTTTTFGGEGIWVREMMFFAHMGN